MKIFKNNPTSLHCLRALHNWIALVVVVGIFFMKEIIIKSKTFGIQTVLVDDEDYSYLNRWKWHISQGGKSLYAMRNETNADGKTQYHVSMHRVIMGVYDPVIEVDHINHNGLHNFKSNLRNCVGDQNKKNRRKGCGNTTSKFIGVSLRTRKRAGGALYKVWVGFISTRKVKVPKKHFPYTEEGEILAAKYYDQLAKQHYGEFANLNFK